MGQIPSTTLRAKPRLGHKEVIIAEKGKHFSMSPKKLKRINNSVGQALMNMYVKCGDNIYQRTYSFNLCLQAV